MPYFDPFQAFESGSKSGKRVAEGRKSAFSTALDTFTTAYDANQERKLKEQSELSLYRKKKDIDVEATKSLYPDITSTPDMMLAGVSATGKPFYRSKNYMKEQAGMRAKAGLNKLATVGAGAQSTPINAATQSLKSATRAKGILFPDGTPASFRRDLAATKGRFLKRATLSRDAQNVAREYGIALDLYNRQVTGAAFNEKEWIQRVAQFQADLLSNPNSAYDSLNRLEELNRDYLSIADPSGVFSGLQGNNQNVKSGNGGSVEQKYDQLVEELVSTGMGEEEAMAQADQEFGL